jgi:magnesium transporter
MVEGIRRNEGQGHRGIWDPTGGEARDRSGLPIDEGTEEIRILARPLSAEGQVREVTTKDLQGVVRDPGLLIWIDILRPREKSARLLQESLGLGSLTVEDCTMPLRMPKIDILPDRGAFVAAFAGRLEDGGEPRLRAVEVDMVIGPTYLVTVRDRSLKEVDERLCFLMYSEEVSPERAVGTTLAHAALDALVDGQLPVVVGAATVAEELEELLDPRDERTSIAALEKLITLRRDLLAFRRLAVAQREVLRRLGRAYSGLGAHLSDVSDNQWEAVDMADATRDYVEGAVEAYRFRRDERSEADIRRLTVLASILGPPTLLAAVYGASFQYIPGTEEPWGFWAFIGAQLVFIVLAIWYLRRRGAL